MGQAGSVGVGPVGGGLWGRNYGVGHMERGLCVKMSVAFVIGGLKFSDNLRILLGTAHPVFSKGLRIDSSERPVEAILPL